LKGNKSYKLGVPKIALLGKFLLVSFGIKVSYKPFSKLQLNIGESIDFKKTN